MLELEQAVTSLRDQMTILLAQDNVVVEELDVLAQRYQQHINSPRPVDANVAEYALFLQQNLDWLHTFIDKLAATKLAVAAELSKVQQGKKAKQGYSLT